MTPATGEGPTTPDPEVRPQQAAPERAEAAGTGGGRLAAVTAWLRGRADNRISRLALLWFRRYLEASRNSGASASAYFTLSALPTALVVIAFFSLAADDENAFAERLITHMKLDGSTADLVRELFGSTSSNVLAASIAIVIGFLIWGLAVGQIYQDLYARAWRLHVGTAADQGLFAIWFFVVSALVGLMTVSAGNLRDSGVLVVVPVWIAGSTIFWLWTPRFLLHRKVALRSLLPGALLASFVIGGTIATSPLWIGPTLNQDAKAFGSFGVVIAIFAYILIFITISMVCAVFSPVWAEWRQAEKDRDEQSAAASEPVTPVTEPDAPGSAPTA
jgi:membrane protein